MFKRQNIFDKNRNIIESENNTMDEAYQSQIAEMQKTIDNLNNQLQIQLNIPNPVPNFMDLGKIPDIVRDIPQFDGNPSKLVQWISDVDGVIELFSQFAGTHQYGLVVRTIRRKIVGEANEVIVNSNTPLSWNHIRSTLTLHYSDRRDLMTLTVQLIMLTRKNDSIETFYAKIQEIHSLLTNSIQLDNTYNGYETGIIRLYSNICLETFIRGVGPMSPFLKNYKPTSLAQAYQYALDFQNTDFRSSVCIPSTIPQVNPRQNYYQPQLASNKNSNNPIKQIYPQYENRFNKFQHNTNNNESFRNQHNQNQNNYQNKFERPVPMEVDKSNRSRFTNFQNKSQLTNPQKNSSWRQNFHEQNKMAHVAQIHNDPYDKDSTLLTESYLNLADENTHDIEQFDNVERNFRLTLNQSNQT